MAVYGTKQWDCLVPVSLLGEDYNYVYMSIWPRYWIVWGLSLPLPGNERVSVVTCQSQNWDHYVEYHQISYAWVALGIWS